MNERHVCRACYHVRQTDADDWICRFCCACSWLLVRDSVHEMAGILLHDNSEVAAKHLLRMLRRVRAVNR